MKNIRLQIDDDLHRDLKLYAIANEKKMPDVIIEALRKFLEQQKVD